ncbi:hypothetical protein SLS53_002575 [Cytospora paraplurivora]|uniref:Uncharacterized protein n=1 Tax=Cytospora paraplurivora TaxID=2898453 RepID=A0AAN9UFL4_9PEZI
MSDKIIPAVTVSLANRLVNDTLINVTCGTGYTRLTGITQASIGLKFDSIARVSGNYSSTCSDTGSLIILPAPGQKVATIVWSAESDYDQTKGNAASDFSYKGEDPGPIVEELTTSAASKSYEALLTGHVEDYIALMGSFTLDLPDTANSSGIETVSGHVEMKLTDLPPDPASAAWMMLHVFDHYDYTRNITWLADTGYPLLKSVASFWISQLQEDLFTNDGTLVVNPCNSPEQGPTTFGCTHYQQLIHQVLEAVRATAPLVSEQDTDFVNSVDIKLSGLDTGLHIDPDSTYGTGVLKEWKVPDSYLYNVYPQHRHLSHLVGWFPGYSICSFAEGYTNSTIQEAVRASLLARGDGTDADGNGGNYGWPKVWRGACWARLNDSARAYEELQLSVINNIAPNLLSMYSGKNPPFQIDMNFGWVGNVLSMLVVDLPLASGSVEGGRRTVVLGPAIPSAWGSGRVKGLRVRGGLVVDFDWDQEGRVVSKRVVSGDATGSRFVDVQGIEL